MYVHIWRMKGRKKKSEAYEKFGLQVTMPALKKIPGCVDAYFVKVIEARKPEYLWLVYWRDKEALEAARTNPSWREQIKKFEAGKFYKTIPLELVCESLGSFGGAAAGKPKKAKKTRKAEKTTEIEDTQAGETSEPSGEASPVFTPPTVEG